MKYIYLNSIFLTISLLIISFSITAQNSGSIKGTVTDSETTDALSFAEILVVGTGQGSVRQNRHGAAQGDDTATFFKSFRKVH